MAALEKCKAVKEDNFKKDFYRPNDRRNGGTLPGRIISPVPIQIVITFNEITKNAECQMSQELPLPTLVQIFCNVLAAYCAGVASQWEGYIKKMQEGGQQPGGPQNASS